MPPWPLCEQLVMHINHISVSTLPVLHRYGGAIERRIIEIAREQARRGMPCGFTRWAMGRGARSRGRYLSFREVPDALAVEAFRVPIPGGPGTSPASAGRSPFPQPAGRSVVGVATSRAKKMPSYDYYAFRAAARHRSITCTSTSCDTLICSCPVRSIACEESQHFWQLPERKLRVLYNGVNMEQFRPDPAAAAAERNSLGIDRRVILYVGRVCKQKGSDVLRRRWSLLNQRRHDLRLVVAGPIGQFG